jgi:uncharacterized protein
VLYVVLAVAVAAYGVLVGGLYAFQRNLLYFPSGSRPELGALAELGVREIEVRTGDGLFLLAWYSASSSDRPTVAYFHGNGGHIGHRADRVQGFVRDGYGLLMTEYRGYGGNPGTPTEEGLCVDGAAALDFLRREGIPPTRLVLYGESLGSGVAVALAAQHDVAGLVLEAPFTSVAEVAQYHYPFVPASSLVRDRFDSLSKIGRVKAPIMILHGERDRVVPVRFGRALFEAALEPKEIWLASEAGHEDLDGFGAFEAVQRFLERQIGL